MSYLDAVSYIKKQQSQSVPKEKIIENLKGVGWHDADINQAFSLIEHPEISGSASDTSVKNSFATTSLVLGICGVVLGFVTGGIVPIAGIVFGILALRRPGHHTKAIWGLSLSGFGLLTALLSFALFFLGFFGSIFGYYDHCDACNRHSSNSYYQNDYGSDTSSYGDYASPQYNDTDSRDQSSDYDTDSY